MWKSVWAVVAGILFVIVVTTMIDIVLHVAGVYSTKEPLTNSLALLATSYRIVIGIAGGSLTAWLAPERPMQHVMILGVVGVVLGLLGLLATWNLGLGPKWYPIALVLLAIPQCWLGGKLWEMRSVKAE